MNSCVPKRVTPFLFDQLFETDSVFTLELIKVALVCCFLSLFLSRDAVQFLISDLFDV
jgi:hypothetical protein